MKHYEERQGGSSFRSGECLGFDICPRPHGIRIRNAISEPSLKFGFVPIRKRCCFHVVDNAVPDCFSDLEPFLNTESVDPEVVQ